MSGTATGAVTDANNQYTNWENTAANNYQGDINNYNSNVNSQIAQGNPYQSKAYIQNQNLMTSGAANSANTAANAATRDTALRTGENTASVAAQAAENGRNSARTITDYNATRDTSNTDKWEQDQQNLNRDQLAGADSEAGMFGTTTGARNAALGDLTNIQDSQDALWQAGIGAVGAGVGGAFKGKA
ncbi:MAG TPA: hypothetical protein VGU67_02905 [Edaphobacter sp.]|nr:hypothetical protein [Edaphobacter sp.]